MSRFGDGDGEGMPLELFRGNVDRALAGKRGQKVLREMREALLALPEKKLVEGSLCIVERDDDDKVVKAEFCAVGALAFHKRVAAGEKPEAVIEALEMDPEDCEGEWETVNEGKRLGICETLAWELAWRNDDGLLKGWQDKITEAERYVRYLAWVESKIAPENLGVGVGEDRPAL